MKLLDWTKAATLLSLGSATLLRPPHQSYILNLRDKMMDILESQFNQWRTNHFSISTNNFQTDVNYANRFFVTTRSKKIVKGDVLNAKVFEELKNAESIEVAIDHNSGIPAPFPIFLSTITSLRSLHLKNLVIPKAVANFTTLSNLEELVMHSCYLEDPLAIIPVGSKLKKLKISSCVLHKGDFDKAKLPVIESFIVNNSDIVNISKDVFLIPTLKKLDLKYNHLSALPVFDGTDVVVTEELDLANNIFSIFPDNINSFKKLKKLNLSSNMIEKFVKDFKFNPDLPLEEIDLSDNVIEKASESIGTLKSIKSINLAHNVLKEVGAEILRPDTLEKLNLSSNHLKELPESISTLPTMLYNAWGIIPGMAPRVLKELDLSYNFLVDLPTSISTYVSLESVNLAGNKFVSIPPILFGLKKLETINFSYNSLTCIPSAIGEMKSLYALDVTGGGYFRKPNGPTNEIKGLPITLVNRIHQKTIKITLKNNPLNKKSQGQELGIEDLLKNYPDWVLI